MFFWINRISKLLGCFGVFSLNKNGSTGISSEVEIFFEVKKTAGEYFRKRIYFNVLDNYLFEVQEFSKAVLNEKAELISREDSLKNAKALDSIFKSLLKKQL